MTRHAIHLGLKQLIHPHQSLCREDSRLHWSTGDLAQPRVTMCLLLDQCLSYMVLVVTSSSRVGVLLQCAELQGCCGQCTGRDRGAQGGSQAEGAGLADTDAGLRPGCRANPLHEVLHKPVQF